MLQPFHSYTFRHDNANYRDTYCFVIDGFKLNILTLKMALSCRSM